MKELARVIIRGLLGIIVLAIAVSGLVVFSLAAMYSDRHSNLT